MTVSSTQSRITFAGNGTTTSFATSPVIFYDTSDLVVYVTTDATEATELLVENTDYTVTGGSGAVGTVSLAGGTSPYGAPASGTTLVIDRQVPATQSSDFVQNDSSDAEVTETALDRLTVLVQQLTTKVGRALHIAVSNVTTTDTEVAPTGGYALGWNAAGTAIVNIALATGTTLVDLAASGGSALLGFINSGTNAVLRTLESVLRETQRVTDYDDADPTGTTDSTAALQAAHDALGANGVLVIPPGTYLAKNFYITKSDITIRCYGTIKPLAVTSTAVIIGRNAAGKTVDTRRLHGNIRVNSGSTFAVYTTATGISINDMRESDIYLDAIGCNRNIDCSPDFTTYPTDGSSTSAQVVYNAINLGGLYNGKQQIYIDPQDANSIVNENNWFGGRFTIDSGLFTTAVCYLTITNGNGGSPNNNRFFSPSFEGGGKCVNIAANSNHIFNARAELLHTGTPATDYSEEYFTFASTAGYCSMSFNSGTTIYTTGLIDKGAGTRTNDRAFTIATDLTKWFWPGAPVLLTVGGSPVYTRVTDSSYSAPNTTIRVSDAVVTAGPTATQVHSITVHASAAAPSIDLGYSTIHSAVLSAKVRALMSLYRCSLELTSHDANHPALVVSPGSSSSEKWLNLLDLTQKTGWGDCAGQVMMNRVATAASPAPATVDASPGTNNVAQSLLGASGQVHGSTATVTPCTLNRSNDGDLISFCKAGSEQGKISQSGGTVSLTAFHASHWTQLEDNAFADLPIGTVLEASDQMCEWPDSGKDERLCRVRVCETVESRAVMGTFFKSDKMIEPVKPDENDAEKMAEYVALKRLYDMYIDCNDIVLASSGRGHVRVAAGEIVAVGDLLVSAGNGCAKVQVDDVYRSKTIGRVHVATPVETHADGSFTVIAGLLCE